jgi:hypothetical protein
VGFLMASPRHSRLASMGLRSMDRAFTDVIIHFALWRDPVRVCEVIADVACGLLARGFSAQEIAAAIDALVDELEGCDQTRH